MQPQQKEHLPPASGAICDCSMQNAACTLLAWLHQGWKVDSDWAVNREGTMQYCPKTGWMGKNQAASQIVYYDQPSEGIYTVKCQTGMEA